jgi:hypothetical protein
VVVKAFVNTEYRGSFAKNAKEVACALTVKKSVFVLNVEVMDCVLVGK